MQQVTLTTYNKLIVNYDTYEMTPSSYSNIAIDNPWYINMSSAPDFINGTYNYQQYMNIVWTGIVGYNIPLGFSYPYKFNHSMIYRQPGYALCFYGEEFEKLYCKLHCTYPATSPYVHSTHSPANNRCIHVPKGQWSVNNFIDAVNSNSSDCYFTLESNNKYIYISSPFRFMINPVCTMATQDTDIVEEWSTRKILIRHPQYKHFTATCTYNGQTFQSEDDYTPATFLRWIYNQTGVKCRIHNYSIICNDTITVGENPFFEFKDNVINNLCGLHTFDYNVVLPNAYKLVGIDNYNDYNPTLTTYDFTTNINTENINTTLNTSKVSLTIS